MGHGRLAESPLRAAGAGDAGACPTNGRNLICGPRPRLMSNAAPLVLGERSGLARRRGWGGQEVFQQLLTPVAGSLPLSFIVAALPVAVALILLGVLRRPAWQASLA